MAFSHLRRPCLICASAAVPFAKLLFVQKPEGGGGEPRPTSPLPGTSLAGTCSQIPAPSPPWLTSSETCKPNRRFPGSPRGRAGVPPQHCRKRPGLCASPTPTVLATSALPPYSPSPELGAPQRLPLSPESDCCGVSASGFPNSVSPKGMRAPNSSTPPLPTPNGAHPAASIPMGEQKQPGTATQVLQGGQWARKGGNDFGGDGPLCAHSAAAC